MDTDHSEAEPGGWPRWAAAVRDALARRSLSVNAAAEHLGIRNTTLRRWLDGAAAPRLSLLPRIADAGTGYAGMGDAGTGIDRDRIADVATLAAADAWRHMHSYGFVPGAATAGGRLRTLFDRHGRPEGDPRRSMVAGARRMPPRRQGAQRQEQTSSGGRADGR